ncbi:helix-turn-helix transcriptional regulator [Vibrio sp. Vb2880]|uniref:helix-turn-helix domain-containing protein n=1 Tax=Vibrio sp. Vb2880 TaxID=2816076 RepID=UPI001A900B41|nr:helix-turn-helix transcriptional regulator [Vibrio fluvialis]MBO0213021.1 helix-turn-helix transcriptional regulator [Vibrio sp. Vb2880]
MVGMKVTEFGKFLRKLRIERDMLLKDMAAKLDVSSAFLSGLELGKKAISDSVIKNIAKEFNLSDEEVLELSKAASVSQPQVKIDLVGKSTDEREIVVSFARKYESLSAEQKEQLKKLLED